MADYTSRDYDSIRADLIARAPTVLPEWTNLQEGDFGVALLEQFAYVGDQMNFYIDRAVNEAFPQTAVLRQSILRIAEARGYTPVQQAAAQTTMSFTLIPAASAFTIPKGTPVLTAGSGDGGAPIRFETDSALFIASLGGTGTVSATEGTTISDESLATSDGTDSQTYPLFNPRVISASEVVEVADGVGGAFTVWSRVQRFVDASALTSAYTVTIDDSNVTHISFGDGINGKVPPIGAAIRVTYRYGVGASGNMGASVITTIGVALPQVASATNTSPATGGADPESIASIKNSISQSQRSQGRAVSLDDYESLAVNVAGVAKASALSTVWTSVHLYVAPAGGGAPSTGLKNSVTTYMAGKILIGSSVTVSDPTYVGINISFDLHVSSAYVQTLVQTAVNQALADFLAFDSVYFAERVAVGSVYKVIHSVPGVDYATLTLMVRASAVTQAGVQDIVCATNEIPSLGTVVITPSGGIS